MLSTNREFAISLLKSTRQFSGNSTDQSVRLMKEFLRREALWARSYAIMDRLPFADLSSLANQEVVVAADLAELIDSYSRSYAEKNLLLNAVKWYHLGEQLDDIRRPRLPMDPYLPIFKLFEIGGSFACEKRVNVDVNRSVGIHAGSVQNGYLDQAFVVIEGEGEE